MRFEELKPTVISISEMILTCNRMPWQLYEDAGNVQFLKSSIFNDSVIKKLRQFPDLSNKLESFIDFKKLEPTQPWGGKDKPFGGEGPIGKSLPKLRYTHLGHDVILFYEIYGRNPVNIKLYGVFSHDEVGIGQPMNIKRQKSFVSRISHSTGALESISEDPLGTVLSWPEFVNNIGKMMKATGWHSVRKDDDTFIFSISGQESDDQYYIVIIENAGNGVFKYGIGTVEEGQPYIDDAFKGQLPTTLASVSELTDLIRTGFGLGESINENFADGKKPGRKGLAKRIGVDCSKSETELRKIAKNSSGEKQRMAHWCANMKGGKNESKLDEKWSEKYKRSIDCSNPKGFSQRAHCQGRDKK